MDIKKADGNKDYFKEDVTDSENEIDSALDSSTGCE